MVDSTRSNAMSGATKAMASTNNIMDPVKMQQTMMEFQKQSLHADMAAEMSMYLSNRKLLAVR
jgi:hypothetical protein